ncbi:MAG: T9SS type A sorting domain-containing protein [Ignavibacteriae bacterium]|nr:T9SS type A sorting domain-containing protein [Ignavibacteriota bacterium]
MRATSTFSLTLLLLIFLQGISFSNDRVDKKKSSQQLGPNSKVTTCLPYKGPGIKLEGSIEDINGGYTIGPERMTSLSGFYDWQTNGDCKHHIYYVSESIIHTAFTTAIDSTNIETSRRTVYSFSSNGGLIWQTQVQVPSNVRSGFAFLTAGNSGASNGSAIIANHSGSPLGTAIHVDAFPGLGSFTHYPMPAPRYFIWPQVNTLSNGNVLVSGNTYQGSSSTDTLSTWVFNPNSGQWIGTQQFLLSNASTHLNMRLTSATGPSGKALLVTTPINDEGGSFGGNRIFYWTSTDYGANWSSPGVLFDTQIDSDGDTSSPWIGLDAIYDDYSNFYVTFNTLGSNGSYSSAKIWINRNGTQNKIVARNTDIPGAMQSAVSTQANMCSMDWPSLSVTQNGHYAVVGYSVPKQNDTVNGFNSMDTYFSLVSADLLGISTPHQITSGNNDERYISLNRRVILNYKIPLVYQKDPQPGSFAFNDLAPLSRATLIYREIEYLNPLTGTGFTNSSIPGKFILYQNYPNPFNPSTSIRFDIPKSGNVRILIYDISGKLVETLIDESLSPGTYEINWNGDRFASGVYFYSLEAEVFKQTRKMLLVK